MKNNPKLSHSFPDVNDALDGETANDIYLFNPGCGQDCIDGTVAIDILRFGAGVLPDDITFVRNGMDLVLDIDNPSGQVPDQLILKNWGGNRSARIKC